MSNHKYGVLRGHVVATAEERGDQHSPHYQIMVVADGEPWRIAVDVKSTANDCGPDRAIALYRIIEDFRHPIVEILEEFPEGSSRISTGSDKDGLDYIRRNLFNPHDMRLLPPDLPGDSNDLNDLLDAHVEQAKAIQTLSSFHLASRGARKTSPTRPFGSTRIAASTIST